MTALQLFSHLSYADRNAFMDSARKVLACPADGCTEQAPWIDAKDAVLKGWAFEDRVVGDSVVRHWFCPVHKRPDDTPPLKPRTGASCLAIEAELSPEAAKLAFGGRRLIVLRLGENNGTQLAVVLRDETFGVYGIQVTGWRASSNCWTLPKLVTDRKILGAPSPRDKRVLVAACEWPPPFLKPRSKGNRR
jgi:hypothetical protein